MAKGGSVERRAADIVRLERHRIRRTHNSKTFVVEGDGGFYVTTILTNAGRGFARRWKGNVTGGVCTCKHGREHVHPEGDEPKPLIPVNEACWHIRACAQIIEEEKK
jgi:hypothetical protein